MPTYVVSSCFMGISELKPYFSDVLFKFPEQNSLKVGIDRNKVIIDIYARLAENQQIITTWLDLMSFNPTSFEEITTIAADIHDEKDIFLFVCSELASNKKIIVDTIQNFIDYNVLNNNKIEYCNKIIQILEKDDAIEELRHNGNTTIITNSNVATNPHAQVGTTKHETLAKIKRWS